MKDSFNAMQPTITTSVSDMLGLEKELIRPVKAQSEDVNMKVRLDVVARISSIRATATTHIAELEQELHAGMPVLP